MKSLKLSIIAPLFFGLFLASTSYGNSDFQWVKTLKSPILKNYARQFSKAHQIPSPKQVEVKTYAAKWTKKPQTAQSVEALSQFALKNIVGPNQTYKIQGAHTLFTPDDKILGYRKFREILDQKFEGKSIVGFEEAYESYLRITQNMDEWFLKNMLETSWITVTHGVWNQPGKLESYVLWMDHKTQEMLIHVVLL